MHAKSKIAEFTKHLIDEGGVLLSNKFQKSRHGRADVCLVDSQGFYKLSSSCRLLLHQLGSFADPWAKLLGNERELPSESVVIAFIGLLESIQETVDHGRLAYFEEMVFWR